MSSDAQLDARLKEIARAAAPGESIADEVMRQIGERASEAPPDAPPPVRESLPASLRPESSSAPRRRRLVTITAALTGLAAGLLLGLGVSRLSPGGPTTAVSGPAVPITVASVEGTVLVKRPSGTWTELAPAAPLYVGDLYQAAPQSQMKLTFKDGSWLTLAGSSRLALEHYNGDVRLHLSHGSLKAALNSPHPPFVVATPTGRIEALGTEFTVSVE